MVRLSMCSIGTSIPRRMKVIGTQSATHRALRQTSRKSKRAHLVLLQSKLHATIAQELLQSLASSATQSDKLGKKVFWLNVVLVILTAVMAASAAPPLLLRVGV